MVDWWSAVDLSPMSAVLCRSVEGGITDVVTEVGDAVLANGVDNLNRKVKKTGKIR